MRWNLADLFELVADTAPDRLALAHGATGVTRSWADVERRTNALARHLAERKAGADVWAQVTCRPIVQQIVMREPTSFYQMPCFAELAALPHADRPKLYADRAWRARVTEQFDSRKWIDPGWKTVTISRDKLPPQPGQAEPRIAGGESCPR